MIKLSKLTKTYKSKNKTFCNALDEISFVLPDKGFVFIIGKSGSGKSTLLNMIGGLDSKTSGDIIVDDKYITNFKTSEYDNYRNDYVGFIFQDFHLIDDLTIFENINLALSLQGIKDDESIIEALKKVDLEGYQDRFPKELSGGQKQRVAIARAIVKNPKIILADEPTGNLDKVTTTQILDLLKELSKEILVCIVSHNINDANKYADILIELADGKVINHLKRNDRYKEEIFISEDTLIIPYLKKLTDEDKNYISTEIKNGRIKNININDEIFEKSEELEYKARESKIKKSKLKKKEKFRLAYVFTKANILRTFISSLILACLLVVLGLSQLIVQFDQNKVITNEMKNNSNTNLVLYKQKSDDEFLQIPNEYVVEVLDSDIENFINSGHKGNIYPLINYGVSVTNTRLFYEKKVTNISATSIYPTEIFGVLVTDKEYVEKIFGSYELILEADEIKDTGIYITDYIADAYLVKNYTRYKTYNDILGTIIPSTVISHGYINGIIKTNYAEKYKSLIQKLNDKNITSNDVKELTNTQEFIEFYEDVTNFLAIGYSFNPLFVEEIHQGSGRTTAPLSKGIFELGNIKYTSEMLYFILESEMTSNSYNPSKENLEDNQIIMNYNTYNKLFGTEYIPSTIKDFIPHTIKYTGYRGADNSYSNPLYSFEAEIISLTNLGSATGIFCSDNLFKKVEEYSYYTFGLYIDEVEDAGIINKIATENNFAINSIIISALQTMAKAVSVFSDFFGLILIFLCVACVLILVNFNIRTIKSRLYEIGIIKSLGGKTIDLCFIFGVQVILVGVLTCILYIIGSILFIDLANSVLVDSLLVLAPSSYIMIDCDFLILDSNVMVYDCILIMIIVLITLVIPFSFLRIIKPTNIIKAKE